MNKQCSKCSVEKSISEYYKRNDRKSGLHSQCKSCSLEGKKQYYKSNSDKIIDSVSEYRKLGGYCVYQATYSVGQYIGSGLSLTRRQQHLSGISSIAKKLGNKATKFQIVFTGTKQQCVECESMLIDSIGIDNLLNTRRATA